VTGHAFTLLGVHSFLDDDYDWVRLVKLRNPWAHKEWSGDWSDSSDKWTDELREKLGVKEEDDGIFFMPYEDYLECYRATNICCSPNPKKYSHSAEMHPFVSGPDPKNIQFYKFTVQSDYELDNEALGLQVFQQGNVLGQGKAVKDPLTQCYIYVACFDSKHKLLFNNCLN